MKMRKGIKSRFKGRKGDEFSMEEEEGRDESKLEEKEVRR